MTTYTPVLPEFDPVLQPIGYALACEFLGGIVAEEDPAEMAPSAPEELPAAVAEVAQVAEVAEAEDAAEEEAPEPVEAADAAATVELLIPVPTSLHGSPIDWFAPNPVDDDEDPGAGFVVRRAS